MRLSPLLIGLILLPLVGCSSVSHEEYNPPAQILTSKFDTKSGYEGTVTLQFKNESTRLKHSNPEEDAKGLSEEDYMAKKAPGAVLGYVLIKWTPGKDSKIGNESAGKGPFYQRIMLVTVPSTDKADCIQFIGINKYSYWDLDGEKTVHSGLNNFFPVNALRGYYRKNGRHEGTLTFEGYKPKDVAKAPVIELQLKFEARS